LPDVRRSLADLLGIQCDANHHASPFIIIISYPYAATTLIEIKLLRVLAL
jgi:hypothetical protein